MDVSKTWKFNFFQNGTSNENDGQEVFRQALEKFGTPPSLILNEAGLYELSISVQDYKPIFPHLIEEQEKNHE